MKDIIKYLVSLSTIIFLVSDFSSINAKAEESSFLDNNPVLKAKLLTWQREAPPDVKRNINILRRSSNAIRKTETVIELGKVKKGSFELQQDIKGAILVLIETFNDTTALQWVTLPSGRRSERRFSPAEEAGKVLARIGEPAVEPLIEALQYKNVKYRREAARTLGLIRDNRASKHLIMTLLDRDYTVRTYSLESLQKMRPRWTITIEAREAVWRFIEALKDEDKGVRRDAVKVLGQIEGESALLFQLPARRQELIKALKQIEVDSAVEPLIEALKDNGMYVRQAAATALGRIRDDRAVEPLIEALKDDYEGVRRAAMEALGSIRAKNAVQPLIEVLKDKGESIDVRKAAATALGRIGDDRAVDPLIKTLEEKDERINVLEAAATALGRIGDDRAVEVLIKTLEEKDENSYVRRNAARASGRIGDDRAVEVLIKTLEEKDENSYVRRNAARALGRIGDDRAVEVLIKTLEEKRGGYMMRLMIAVALKKITGEDFDKDYYKWKDWWESQDRDNYYPANTAR